MDKEKYMGSLIFEYLAEYYEKKIEIEFLAITKIPKCVKHKICLYMFYLSL
mgnify:CR=1 FL=1